MGNQFEFSVSKVIFPELLEEGKVYYAITDEKNSTGSGGRNDGVNLLGTQFQVATSITNANAATPISQLCYYSAGSELRVESRVSDKKAGEIGHPLQYDYVENNWFVYCSFLHHLTFKELTTSTVS